MQMATLCYFVSHPVNFIEFSLKKDEVLRN